MNTSSPPANLSLFFDESGKRTTVELMGALCIPTGIYKNETNIVMHQLNEQFHYHWSDYSGDYKMRLGIVKLFELASPMAQNSKLNILRYNQSIIENDSRRFTQEARKELIQNTIYSKFPERIMYGLLRQYDRATELTAELFIEHAFEYTSINLAETIKLQLNSNALYRGRSYTISRCDYRIKKEELGVELTDLLIGIVRTIIENKDSTNRRASAQRKLVLYLYKRELLQPFFQNLSLFEWNKQPELDKKDFKNHLNMFLAKHYVEYNSLRIEE